MIKKRRRLAQSCRECRRRKVKCDRTTPACLRCEKNGTADSCVYVPYETDSSPSPSHTLNSRKGREGSQLSWTETAADYAHIAASGPPATASHRGGGIEKRSYNEDMIQKLEQKIADLEVYIEESRSHPTFTPQTISVATPSSIKNADPSCRNKAIDLEQVVLRGRSLRTLYHGPSHCASILLQFEELSTFIRDCMTSYATTMSAVKRSHSSFKQMRNDLAQSYKALTPDPNTLRELIPDRASADSFVRRYTESFETTYRVLHVPSFLKQYEEFWMAPSAAETSFLVILLLVIAVVQCVNPHEEQQVYLGWSSAAREKAAKSMAVCRSWLDAQSYKRTTLATYQVRVLLFMAKRTNSIKVKRDWIEGGSLLRHAMSAGFHRDPANSSTRISVFEQEMRRRLWGTILELELLTAIDKGMPVALGLGDWDCQAPANIHDEDLSEDSSYLPPSRPLGEFTRTSYLCISSESVQRRIDVISMVNRIKPALTLDIAAQFDLRVRQALSDIPLWAESTEVRAKCPPSRIARTLARLQLLELTMLIYRPFATAKGNPAHQFFSRAALRDAAASSLESYQSLSRTEELIVSFWRQDAVRAGVCICFDLCTESMSTSSVTFNRSRALELLEYATKLQVDYIVLVGQGCHHYSITSCALSLAHWKQEEPAGANLEKYASDAMQRVTWLNDHISARQAKAAHDGGHGKRQEPGETTVAEACNVRADGDGATPSALDLMLTMDVFELSDIWNADNWFDFYA